ncbi:MAG: transglutaminase family protein [Candidatus Nephthysia bennettiae]|uniref:Transglutaminase family protein n=1 Tax=Candidatus Nephthysia bennettiae TaxID=3127016 RepID=A0A934NBX8_9BACT|nr:transglutaminase family protein [Candidatus Dormibacteraeota bacterium]PZR99414.1 MAG: transglutaminase family protein [Candidatus Dormibacteraeota bacterium]
MRLQVTHVTSYRYSAPISETHMEVRLRPSDGMGQRLVSFQLELFPEAPLREYVDGFGNHVHHFDHLPEHDRVELISRSVVETGRSRAAADGDRPDDLLLFRPPVVDGPGVRRLAERHRPRDLDSAAAVETALDRLTVAISRDFEYRPLSTTVTTAVDEVLRLRTGVCQDFAHLFIAVARAMGVPTRYVSGYVHSGGDLPTIGASHAWAEAWLPGRGWIGYDATHPIRAGENHVRVAVGRDYRDAAPTRGVYVGAARGQLDVRVEVQPL